MRTLFVTGPGGAGRTTLAAATALAAARDGARTLLLSADTSDTLGAALGTPTGPRPESVAPGLTALRPDPDAGFRAGLLALQEHARPALDLLGADHLDDEELTPLPGAEDLALLGAIRAAATHGTSPGTDGAPAYDTVVVDLPAAPRAVALLALPAQLRRYLRRLLPQERQAARALRPVLGRLAGVPVPTGSLYEAAARWDAALAAAQAVIEDPATGVRLVAEPGPAGADAVARTATGLALYGLGIESLVANRVLPGSHDDAPWLAALRAQQDKTLGEWAQDHRTHEVAHRGQDPRGTDDLTALGVPGPGDPAPVRWPVLDALATDSLLTWAIPLPGVVRDDLHLVRRGDELVVTAGPFRRIVPLPSALRRCTVTGAGLSEGALRIRFAPDPGLWPRTR
ncbi:ArsA family ATPase [Streptomyces sp. p1417]|uniref:ArsA family ATPase n=1 Tax=Streptomyces typhae TaxID=2681492 RepID=A0A6L6X5N8_9ACTN|nr:ArsA-related P-loop ATPase [Streptomyces typhae]MVO89071.1 ArsA family ATPase [Streptomyces typhae]